jgi:hypothetical protein
MTIGTLTRQAASFVVIGVLLAFPIAANASAVLFNFEEVTQGNYSMITSMRGGITTSIFATDSTLISVVGPEGPASWGNNSLIDNSHNGNMALVFNFSQAISDPRIQFGDFDADDDTEVMTAFSGLNGTGSNVGSNSVFYPASEDISNGDSDVATLAVTASDVLSIEITSPEGVPNPFPFSVFFRQSAGQRGTGACFADAARRGARWVWRASPLLGAPRCVRRQSKAQAAAAKAILSRSYSARTISAP